MLGKSIGLDADERRGFALIELLVVISIIAILAALLLPALAQGRAQAQSTSCKNHLRQMSIAMRMYVDDARMYPPGTFWANGFLGSGIYWVEFLRPYYPLDWTNRGYHCPAYKGYIVAPYGIPGSVTSTDYFGSYGYNAEGTWQWGAWPDPNLGLGGLSEPDHRSATITEAQVLMPSDMIQFGEPRELQVSLAFVNNRLLWSSFELLRGGSDTATGNLYRLPLRHGRNCNVVFCDGHVEGTAPSKLFNMTNSALRWNNDHQPHPETWKWY
jgi:prepilin-type N-terminal cleavage/methylation domain-containing protein/prepilin-type processing-associated H-X9-DG protein